MPDTSYIDAVKARYEALAAERGWSDPEAPQARMLQVLVFRAEESRNRVARKAGELSGSIGDLERRLRNPSAILNDLGELQAVPGTVEAAVGAYHAASSLLRDFLEIYPAGARQAAGT